MAWQTTSPCIQTKKVEDYHYIRIADSWKVACSRLPSDDFLAWPTYATKTIHIGSLKVPKKKPDGSVTEEKHGPLVIQLWKGWCQRLGTNKQKGVYGRFPGGVGAEVCVYQSGLGALGAGYFPYLKHFFKLKFELSHKGDVFFTSDGETSYWCTKWMSHDDYKNVYKPKHHGKHPINPAHFKLRYWIDDVEGHPWG